MSARWKAPNASFAYQQQHKILSAVAFSQCSCLSINGGRCILKWSWVDLLNWKMFISLLTQETIARRVKKSIPTKTLWTISAEPISVCFAIFIYFFHSNTLVTTWQSKAKKKEDRSTFFCVTRNSKINVEIIQLHAPNCDAWDATRSAVKNPKCSKCRPNCVRSGAVTKDPTSSWNWAMTAVPSTSTRPHWNDNHRLAVATVATDSSSWAFNVMVNSCPLSFYLGLRNQKYFFI